MKGQRHVLRLYQKDRTVTLFLIEPGVFYIEETQVWYEPRERQRIDRKLGERLIRAGVGLVVEDMYGSVSHLQKINVPGDRLVTRGLLWIAA
jgi:hypothetical protein